MAMPPTMARSLTKMPNQNEPQHEIAVRYLGARKHRQEGGNTSVKLPTVMATKAKTEETVQPANRQGGQNQEKQERSQGAADRNKLGWAQHRRIKTCPSAQNQTRTPKEHRSEMQLTEWQRPQAPKRTWDWSSVMVGKTWGAKNIPELR